MNAITKTVMTLEHHCLQLSYAPLRLYKQDSLNKLMGSIEQHGQLVPVVVVPKDTHQWVLMDGYLRVNALQRFGKDTVNAEVWKCEPAQALLMLLREHQSRTWEVFEEALLLQELHTQHGFSQQVIAQSIGRDQSWVSRRLALLEHLPEFILQAVSTGKLSLWSAARVLAPMARAIPAHAELLLQHLFKQPLSTRDLKFFYDHYQRSNHQQRSKMVNDPDLFFKAQKLLAAEKQAMLLQAGPEGQWRSQLRLLTNSCVQLKKLVPTVFTPQQETHEHDALLSTFCDAQTQFNLLTETIRSFMDVNERSTANHFKFAPDRTQLSSCQPTA